MFSAKVKNMAIFASSALGIKFTFDAKYKRGFAAVNGLRLLLGGRLVAIFSQLLRFGFE
jgi:hypothetical protein